MAERNDLFVVRMDDGSGDDWFMTSHNPANTGWTNVRDDTVHAYYTEEEASKVVEEISKRHPEGKFYYESALAEVARHRN